MSWNNRASDLVPLNGICTTTLTTNFYLPLTGRSVEDANVDALTVSYVPNGKTGLLRSLCISSSTAMGVTVITIYDRDAGAVIGTKTVTLLGPDILNNVIFTNQMDSGTNEFDGDGAIAIGINPATGGDTITFSTIFERGLF